MPRKTRAELVRELFAGSQFSDANPCAPDWKDEFTVSKLLVSSDTYYDACCNPATKWGRPGPVIQKDLVDYCQRTGIPRLRVVQRFSCGRMLVYDNSVEALLKWPTKWIANGGGSIGYYIPWGYWKRRRRVPLSSVGAGLPD